MSFFLTNYTVPNLSEWMKQPRQQFGPIAAGRPQQMGGILGRGMPASAPTPAPNGQIAPAEAQSLSALIEAQRKAIETGELLERLEKLEAIQTKR